MRSAWIDKACRNKQSSGCNSGVFGRRQDCDRLTFSDFGYSDSEEMFLSSEKRNERDAQCNLASRESLVKISN